MATGRIGVTPTLGTRWSKAPSAGTTSLSGLDDSSVSLVYSVGYEQVYRNGVLLSRGNDYTATSGNSITLTDATVNGDIIEVFANELVPLTDAISKGQFTAKGSLLSASAASTPAVLAVGTNNQVLTADSSTSTGLKWATPSSGAMVLLSRQTFSNVASISFANVFTTTYENYLIYFTNVSATTATDNFQLQLQTSGGAQASDYYGSSIRFAYNSTTLTHEQSSATTAFNIYEDTTTAGGQLHITGSGAGQSGRLCWTGSVTDQGSGEGAWFYGFRESTTTYTGITFKSGSTNITGTIAIYGLVEA